MLFFRGGELQEPTPEAKYDGKWLEEFRRGDFLPRKKQLDAATESGGEKHDGEWLRRFRRGDFAKPKIFYHYERD